MADNNLFDVPMGSYMVVDIFDLIGYFLLNNHRILSKSECIGSYIKTGLMVTNRSECDQERICKHLRSNFKEHDFDITIEKDIIKLTF